MRIAVVQPKVDRSGGAEAYALGLVGELARRGHEVHVFARRAEGLPHGVRFHRVPSVPFGRALKTFSFWHLTERRVRPGAFDVVHGAGKTTCQTVHRCGGGVHRAYLEREGKATRSVYDRVVLRIEDRLFSSPGLRAVVCPSRWVAEAVERFYPDVAERIRIIPNGVDTERFTPEGREEARAEVCGALGIPVDARILLFVGTNFRLKGLDLAVEALARLPGAHLVVVGGDAPGPFAARAREFGCADRVHFVGPQREMLRWYRAADVLVHPTRYDPFANVCVEALACGTPVVTSPENGAADVLAGCPEVARLASDGSEMAWAVEALQGGGEDAPVKARRVAEANAIEAHVRRMEEVYLEAKGIRE
ncbi:glycosyltransferase family 4 protein [Deferrisoma sp.]